MSSSYHEPCTLSWITAPSIGAVPELETVTERSITVTWEIISCIHRNGAMVTFEARLNGRITISTSNTRATFSNLNPSTNYSIEVRARNPSGVGPFGVVLTAVTSTLGTASG